MLAPARFTANFTGGGLTKNNRLEFVIQPRDVKRLLRYDGASTGVGYQAHPTTAQINRCCVSDGGGYVSALGDVVVEQLESMFDIVRFRVMQVGFGNVTVVDHLMRAST